MSKYINEALLGTAGYQKQRDQAKALTEKWDKTGLLDGLEGDFDRGGMAQLLENQARELIKEASSTSPSAGSAGAYKGDEEWSGVALPLVRRIFGEIAAQEFVSVQPMNLPSGLVFYLDFQYGSSRMGFDDSKSIHGKTGKYSPSGSSAPYGEDSYAGGFYGAGRYGYTMATGSDTTLDIASAAQATWKDINFNSELSSSVNAGEIFKVTSAITATNVDKLAIRAAVIASGSISAGNPNGADIGAGDAINRVFPELFSIDGTDGVAGTLTWFASASSADDFIDESMTLHYPKYTTEAVRGDFEDTTGDATSDSLQIPQVDIELKSRAIVAKTRKLKAVWTPELAQDLNAYHSVDGEAELTSMLTEYVSMEIDLEILDMLISDAQTVDYWSAKIGNEYNAANNAFSTSAGGTFTGTKFEWWQTLIGKVQKVSNEIHKLTLRGGANFVVCGPTVATILESLPGYMADTDGDKQQFAMGVQKIGGISNRWTVYKNPYMTENTILVGFRGSNFLETGAVYAPYVPLIMTPLVYDPNDFTPRKGVMTRYAKKMVRPEFYGKIYVDGLDLV